jgi:hypothetical protein
MSRELLFLNKISPEPNSGCWLWTAAVDQFGYGLFGVGGSGKNTRAHRWAYEYYKGKIPPKMKACHTCDVPSCVNPDHLFIGTDADNIRDRNKKNRTAKGVKIGNSVIKPEQVSLIRSSALSERSLAKELKVSRGTINAIRSGRTWSHI